jgi:hypothetical protein
VIRKSPILSPGLIISIAVVGVELDEAHEANRLANSTVNI